MRFSLLTCAAVLTASSCSASPAPRNQLQAVDTSHLPIRRDPTRPQPILQQRTGAGAGVAVPAGVGETVIVIGGGAGAAPQGAAKPTVTNLQTVTTRTTVAGSAGTAPPAMVMPPPALGTGGAGAGAGAAQPSGTGALPAQQPAPTQSLLPVTAGADPARGSFAGGEVAVVVGLVSVVWGGFWMLV